VETMSCGEAGAVAGATPNTSTVRIVAIGPLIPA
jgi:hypothetical protein